MKSKMLPLLLTLFAVPALPFEAMSADTVAEGTVSLHSTQDGSKIITIFSIDDVAIAKPLFESLSGREVAETQEAAKKPHLVVSTRRDGRNLSCTKVAFTKSGETTTRYFCSMAYDENGRAFEVK